MKKVLFLVLAILALNFVSAVNLDVSKQDVNEFMIKDINEPAVFNLTIRNTGQGDFLQFYNLLGFSMAPKGTVGIGEGETKNVLLFIYPREDLKNTGPYNFNYFIRGQDGSEIKQDITVKIINLDEAFEVGSEELDPESNSVSVFFKSNVGAEFDDMKVRFKSPFFDFEESFSLKPRERKEFRVELNKEDFKKLLAGFYTISAEAKVRGKETEIEGTIKFSEKDILVTEKKNYGFFINTEVIEKKNEGNVPVGSETNIKKNIISRLFTSFNPEPDLVERDGIFVHYTWNREVQPGETLYVNVKTNWLFPLLIIFFIVAIVALARQYSLTNLVLRKRVSFVRAKGGEFALKVTIVLTARKDISRVSVFDRLPSLVKVYERFGSERPTRIDEKNRRIEWDFEHLGKGEKRVLSYIIYSKVGVLGKFELPSATAVYDSNGDIKEAESNRAFFVAEQRKGELEEE